MRTDHLARDLRRGLHLPVLVPAALLAILGVLFLTGVRVRVGRQVVESWHVLQMSGIAVGMAVSLVVLLVPYKRLVANAYLFYGGCILLLLLVLVAGTSRNQARRWLSILGFDFQPSEFMKIVLVLTLARFIRFRRSYKSFKGLGWPFSLTLVPMALVLVQPDLGTALICLPVLFTMLFVAGARLRHLLTIALLGMACVLPVYQFGLKDYQRARIRVFLAQLHLVEQSAEEKRLLEENEGYQLRRSQAAIGSGGLAGVGLGEGEYHAAHFVPERHNDFVFAVVGNEWGLLGALLVILLYVALLVAILNVGNRHRDPAGRLICTGVFALLAFQAFVNMAMTVGLMPITGLTLPFLSYGRSSMVVSLVAVALVCNVAARPSYEFGRGDFD